ncbi:MAG: T9SS type A sorting domain-containing protein, partial [Bacteroidetes bacterium]|nr:T9SS type A sorting domain-containing protein [Bacteroidota bacterium]
TNKAVIKVYNMLGEQVSQKQIQNQDIHSFSMDCSAGYYFVEISTIVGNEVFKVFIN